MPAPPKLAALYALALLPAFAAGAAEPRVGDFRAKMEKWVETRQILSEEASEWQVEQETLKATRDLLREQKEALAAEIAELEASSTAADDDLSA